MFPAPDATSVLWKKSSRSTGNGACVEIAFVPGVVAVRDSKDSHGPVLQFGPAAWRGFVGSVRGDHLR